MNQLNINNIDFTKLNGLIPAIIQDAQTQQVLMLGFMNKKSLKKTIETNKIWFFSRSRNKLWMKGEESGNVLNLISIVSDCDNDTLLIQAKPYGPTCHTGEISCFGNQNSINILLKLFKLINDRKATMPKGSYTTSLFKDGLNKICDKIEEESLEVIKAAKKETKQRLIEESCDLIYHLMVLLANEGVELTEVFGELGKRRK